MSIAFFVPLAAAIAAIYFINRKVSKIMATVQNLKDHVAAVETGVAQLAAEIADLKTKGVLSQDELDALDAQVLRIETAIEAAK